MIAELGRYGLILALMIAIAQASLPLIGAHRRDDRFMRFGDYAALGQFAFTAFAFACLTIAFVRSDFSLEVVAANSHTLKPLIYKIAGVWGNHEGSMLLWVLILSLFGATIGLFGGAIPGPMRARALAVQAMIGVGFFTFLIFTSDPFARLDPAPAQGAGLNPLLQDPGLASHPPFLYLGYVGFSTAFSFAVAALIEGRADSVWARFARPWILAAWCFLTFGIMLGSLWAYCVLGWGGFWFWDPVENASLMPWLLGTALVHSVLVVEKRHTMVRWSVLLGILTFSMSLIGTFVVRSGILTSVHAFAVDPGRGVFILALLILATGGSLMLYALRAGKLGEGPAFELVSREGSLVLNNMLLVTLTSTVFLGTFYPLFIDLVGKDKISVGPPFYALTFAPLALPLLATAPLGPLLRWREGDAKGALSRLRPAAVGAAVVVAFTLLVSGGEKPASALAAGLGAWLVFGAVALIARRVRWREIPLAQSWRLAHTLPRGDYGVALAHLGVGLLVIGVVGASSFKSELVTSMKLGDSVHFAGRDLRLMAVDSVQGPNYQAQRARFAVTGAGGASAMSPERRYYPERDMETTKAAIAPNPVETLYVSTGAGVDDSHLTVRLYHHPLAIWIWLGGAVMAAGGAFAWAGTRARQRAGARAAAAAPAPDATPAG